MRKKKGKKDYGTSKKVRAPKGKKVRKPPV
jgi:hypothetical protein